MKIGIIGAGHLGQFHVAQSKEIEGLELVGLYDSNPERAKEIATKFDCIAFPSIEELINAVDIVDIVTPTLSHYDCAKAAIENNKHVFIEKPITNTVTEAEELIELSQQYGVKVQVGHIERFNPAFVAAKDVLGDVQFIETHRLSQFNPRGTDVSVVLDLMIHDLDIVLSSINSDLKDISASGVAVISDTPDIANARLEFENGCVANLTASRISLKNMRKSRFFQKDAYISVDFFEKKSEIVQMKDVDENTSDFAIVFEPGEGKKAKEILFSQPEIPESNAIRDEIASFYSSIKNNETPVVTIQDGYRALKVAHQILEKIGHSTIKA